MEFGSVTSQDVLAEDCQPVCGAICYWACVASCAVLCASTALLGLVVASAGSAALITVGAQGASQVS